MILNKPTWLTNDDISTICQLEKKIDNPIFVRDYKLELMERIKLIHDSILKVIKTKSNIRYVDVLKPILDKENIWI